ncbi:unnamed protein product [Symbiodinium pilosum]|uniref:PLA2c domain-containing protein n=1 Tax=Symbiodinium pilosum TaxID=2952 RepID=A0A812Y6T7_SYMPI|nr:unnamed protein product [Symbiodinium pilosum]
MMFGCHSYRGPVQCVSGKCVCQAGYCSANDGSCHRPKPPIKAHVALVNSEHPTFPGSQAAIRTGVCFSGGGSRALSFALGILRALESLQLIPHVDAISSVSGGTWASSIYMFAQNVSVKELLGEDTTPNDLTMQRLQSQPPRLGDVATTNILSLLWRKYVKSVSNPHDLWIDVYAEAVLKPFGLANRSQFMAADEASLQRILERNPELQREQFLVPNPLRPKTYIMGGTILAPVGLEATERSAVSLQMSPDYTGSPFYPQEDVVQYEGAGDRDFLVGGGMVESFAFGGSTPLTEAGQMGEHLAQMEAPPSPFSLADAIGISSAAFASVLVSASGWLSAVQWIAGQAREYLPVKDYWPVLSHRFRKWRSAMKYELGDGAETDNTGMMALLQRRVQKIVVVHSTNVELSKELDFCIFDLSDLDLHKKVSNDLLDKFGHVAENAGEYLVHNQVFPRKDLQPLLCEFQKKRKAGDPLVVERQLEVLENKKWGIRGNFQASVIFVYLSGCDRFDMNLPPETLEEVQKGRWGKFNNWPHFKTSSQNSGKFTSYTPEQVNLLSALGEYMMLWITMMLATKAILVNAPHRGYSDAHIAFKLKGTAAASLATVRQCPQRTGGTCSWFGYCWQRRGPTRCVNGECMCKPGYCSDDDGRCHKKMPDVYADIVPVNDERTEFPPRQANLQTAICLSGGGTRAMVAAIGALRGLEYLNLLVRTDLLVSVSGGTWTAGPFMFSHDLSKGRLLGNPTRPSELSLEELTKRPSLIGDSATHDIYDLLKSSFLNNDDPHGIWVNAFNEVLLKPIGLGNMSKYMAPDENTVQRIVRDNPHLQREDFIIPAPERPRAFVMLGVLLAPLGHESADDTVVSLQMSPDFSGSPFYPGREGQLKYDEEGERWLHRSDIPALKMVIGGGMVETFAFGSDTPFSSQSGGHHVKMPSPSEPFSLAKAVGVSSAAFSALTSQAMDVLGGQTAQALIPVSTLWPVTSKRFPGPKAAAKFKIGDGGHMDNSGLMPALQRKVPRIAMFLDTDVKIGMKSDFCAFVPVDPGELSGAAAWYFVDKFGLGAHVDGSFLMHNQVFRFKDLQPILCDLQTHRRAGRPAVSLRDLEVIKNSWWGIEGGWTVKLLVYHLDNSKVFENQLPADTQKELAKGKKGMFANFPQFSMVKQNPRSLISYTSAQVNLLSALVEFGVREHAGYFREVLAGIPRNLAEWQPSAGFEDLHPREAEGGSEELSDIFSSDS